MIDGSHYVDPLLSNELDQFNRLYALIFRARLHIRNAAQSQENGLEKEYSSHLGRLGNTIDKIQRKFGSKGITCFYEYKSDNRLFKTARRLYRQNGGQFTFEDIDFLKNFHKEALFYHLPFIDHEIRLNAAQTGIAIDMAYSVFGFNPDSRGRQRQPYSNLEEQAAIVHHFSLASNRETEQREPSVEKSKLSKLSHK